MNCIDFRRLALVDPRQPDGERERHAAGCAACREFLERQRELDASLYAALQAPVPDGLADRILVARGLRGPRRWPWALAASLVAAVAIALAWPGLAGETLGREAIAHVAHEPHALRTNQPVSADHLPSLLSSQGLALASAMGEVTFSVLCPLGDGVARHLVVRTADGERVTVFLLPEDTRARRRAVVERDGMAAITLPAGRGTVAIVAGRLDQALAFERALRRT